MIGYQIPTVLSQMTLSIRKYSLTYNLEIYFLPCWTQSPPCQGVVCFRAWNFPFELGQCGACWCPGSLHHQVIGSHDIDLIWQTTCLPWFLAATKQLYEWYFPSVRPSVRPSHLFDYVPIIVSSWNFQELLPMTEVTTMPKVKVRGQRSRSQRSQPNLTVSGL